MLNLITVFLFSFNISNASKISYSIAENPKTLDPQLVIDENDIHVTSNLYETLIRINEKNIIEPAMAYKWEFKGRKILFFIRNNTFWSNGDKVTAYDFVYSFERALTISTESPYSYLINSLNIKNSDKFFKNLVKFSEVGIKALNSEILEIELDIDLEEPIKTLAPILSFVATSPMNQKFSSNNPEFAKNKDSIISNGAWKIDKWNSDDKIILIKNLGYYNKDNIKLEKIKIFIIKDDTTNINMYKSNMLDLILKINSNYFDQLNSLNELHKFQGDAVFYLEFNNKDSIMSNKNIRKAISMSIRRDVLCKNVLKNTAEPTYAIVPKGFLGIEKDFRVENKEKLFDENINLAKQLLEVGIKELNLKELSIKLLSSNDETQQKVAQYIQQELNKIGIKVELESTNKSLRISRQIQGDYQVVLSMWAADYPSYPLTFLDRFQGNAENNFTFWSNVSFDNLIRNVTSSKSYTDKIKFLGLAEKILCDINKGEFPICPLYTQYKMYACKNDIKGVKVYSGSYNPDLRSVLRQK